MDREMRKEKKLSVYVCSVLGEGLGRRDIGFRVSRFGVRVSCVQNGCF